jgi:hypothetical protein
MQPLVEHSSLIKGWLCLALQEHEIQRLRALLATYTSTAGGSPISSGLSSPDSSLRQQQHQQQMQQWAADETESNAEQQHVEGEQRQVGV